MGRPLTSPRVRQNGNASMLALRLLRMGGWFDNWIGSTGCFVQHKRTVEARRRGCHTLGWRSAAIRRGPICVVVESVLWDLRRAKAGAAWLECVDVDVVSSGRRRVVGRDVEVGS
jgi:hypothetical protein